MYSVLPSLPVNLATYLRYSYYMYMMILSGSLYLDFKPRSHITSRGDVSSYLVHPNLVIVVVVLKLGI